MSDRGKKFNQNHIHDDDFETTKINYVVPEFDTDGDVESPRVLCLKHTEITHITALSKSTNKYDRAKYEKMLTCKTCMHYFDNDCYFPKSEIEKIDWDRMHKEIPCKLCGNKIDRPLTIMQSLFHKEKHNIEIPLMCCSCYVALNDDSFIQNSRKKIIFFIISTLISIYFLVSYFVTIFFLSYWGILIIVIPFIFWISFFLRNFKNVYYIWKGRKYYETLFGNTNVDSDLSETEEK